MAQFAKKNAIKGLNMEISIDAQGHPDEIFRDELGGDLLLRALVKLLNNLKDKTSEYPEAM